MISIYKLLPAIMISIYKMLPAIMISINKILPAIMISVRKILPTIMISIYKILPAIMISISPHLLSSSSLKKILTSPIIHSTRKIKSSYNINISNNKTQKEDITAL